MTADVFPVHPDLRKIVAPLKMEQQPFGAKILFIVFYFTPIPKNVVVFSLFNPARRGLIAERNADLFTLGKSVVPLETFPSFSSSKRKLLSA